MQLLEAGKGKETGPTQGLQEGTQAFSGLDFTLCDLSQPQTTEM